MEKSSPKALGYIKMGLFYLVAFLLVIYIMLELFLPEQTVKVFQFKPYVVLTQSMEPEINKNDMVIVKSFDIDELEKGDIITFYADIDNNGNDEIVTHYINEINRSEDGSYTILTNRHFNSNQEVVLDRWELTGDDVLGLYNFHIPWIGTVILFLQSPFGIAAMVVNIGVIVAVVVMIKQGKKEENEDEKSE